MPQNPYSPFSSFIHFISLARQGKVRFPKGLKGTRIRLDDGEWLVLRELVISPELNSPEPEAVFRPRFHIKGMSARQNEWFSWLPIPFFAGLPGFRRKLWLLDPASGDFSGYYEWQTESDANAYAQSFAMRFMTARSIPGSVSARIQNCSALFR
ncbi:hypothetical protein [Leptolinea tardivitalis]|uniref:ABM domain-containing protein n=1 Tax=Leptolinea tardivitalis TaxID=229920 RepID=A0A0P6XPD1_9CHLR|nr:hypothetical protein [Leptolinea tardivitalis]KPL74004.1 hypothetical protein ADM99_01835 [Leptolinea tardivitalis]GAP22637.1 hypothetical protein LTAR_02876 [Leptolinea tardivitalis]